MSDEAPVESKRPSDLKRLLVLLLLALAVRTWTVINTTVPSRDCIVFVRDGLQLETPTAEPSRVDFLRKKAEHPPGYPMAIIAMSWLVRPLMGGTTVESMALSAQLVSLVAGVLLVIPLFLIARRLFERNVAFAAVAIFTVLPVCVEVTSDGISDGLFLLTAAWALWFGIRATEQERLRPAFLFGLGAGLCCGIGYVIRPDAAVVATGIGLVFAGMVIGRVRKKKWKAPFVGGLGLVIGTALAMGPYCVTIGGLSKKATFEELIGRLLGKKSEKTFYNQDPTGRAGPEVPLAAWWSPSANAGESKPIWAIKALWAEYSKAAHYSVPFFGLIGLISLWRRLTEARIAVLIGTAVVHLTVLWILAWQIDYVSQRHTLLTVMITCIFAAASLPRIGGWLISVWKGAWIQRKSAWQIGSILAILIIATALPRDVRSLHYERAGHKAAGRWIKEHCDPNTPVVDPFGWAEWYSGRTLSEYPNPNPLPDRERYIVFEPNAKSPHSRLGTYEFAKEHHVGQEMVYWYPKDVPSDRIQVAVYHFKPAKPAKK